MDQDRTESLATDEWLTVAEAAMWMRISPRALRAAIARGAVPAYRLAGRRIRIRRSDLTGLAVPR